MISFKSSPVKNHEIQYKCDERKDKCIKGQYTKYPSVKISAPRQSSGFLKVVCMSHNANSDGNYSLHPNLLINNCNEKNLEKHCDEFGVAVYKFQTNTYGEALIELKNLCIRHAKKEDVATIKQNWNLCKNKFDPYGVGYCLNKFDLQRVRLACQAFFLDLPPSNTLMSDVIVNGRSDIKIEYWDENIQANVEGGYKLHILMRKLTTDQKNLVAIFSDNEGWESGDCEPLYNHHELAMVFEIPAYKNEDIEEPVMCKFQLMDKDKKYFSETKRFKYIPKQNGLKRSIQTVYENYVNNFQEEKRPRLNQNNINNLIHDDPNVTDSFDDIFSEDFFENLSNFSVIQ